MSFADQNTRAAVRVMLEAGCTAQEIRAWLSFQTCMRIN